MPVVVFEADDTGQDLLDKMNSMSQQAGDVQQAKTDAEQAVSDAQGKVEDCQGLVGQAAQHEANAQAIAETGLPSQLGNENKALVSDGISTSWQAFTTPAQLAAVLNVANNALIKADEAKITARIGLVL